MSIIEAGLVEGHLPFEQWNKKNLVDWVLACRKQGGYPMFISRFAGKKWKFKGTNAVQGKCFAGEGPEISVYFVGVPDEDEKLINEGTQDWVKLMKKYAPDKLKEAEKYPLIIKSGRIPRVIVKG